MLVISILPEAPYWATLLLQRALHQRLKEGTGENTLLICRHEPIVTLGKSTDHSQLSTTKEWCSAHQVSLVEVERGGSITYHGPQQVVAYPILNLEHFKKDVGWYVRSLEEVLIRTLLSYNIVSTRRPSFPGVWIQPSPSSRPRKIGFVGVKLSRWCTFHGMSLTVFPSDAAFSSMTPCGLKDIDTTSVAEEINSELFWEQIASKVVESFCDVFEISAFTFVGLSYFERHLSPPLLSS